MSLDCRCEPHAQASNRCLPCQAQERAPVERPSGTSRSPYARRDSAMLRIAEIDRDLEQMIDVKRKLLGRVRQIEAEIDACDTQRSNCSDQAPEREVRHVGEI